jgi:cytochrome c
MMRTNARASANACVAVISMVAWPDALLAQSTDVPKKAPATVAAGTVPTGAASGGDAGQLAFNNKCRMCHSSDPGDNRLGPSLGGVVGRTAGSVSGFAYSQSMKNAGVTWDEATLDKFITDPGSVVPGNRMKPYTGIDDAEVRSAIISFLKTAD